MLRDDDVYLLDMLIAAREALGFIRGLSREQFLESSLHQAAATRALEVLGEAARLVSPGTRDEHPEVPWERIIGMRNRLLHEYFRVNLAIVWQTIEEDIPPLIDVLTPIVPEEPA